MLMLAVAAALQAPVPFDFKGTQLGSTVAEFRALPTQSGQYGPRRAVCTGEPGAMNWLEPLPPEKEIGVTMCGRVENIGGSWARAWVELTPEYSAAEEYSFYHDRLFQIAVYPDLVALRVVEDGLIAKFGQPNRIEQGTFQTESGALFPQRVLTWTRGAQVIRMEAPALNTRKMQVLYLDTAITRAVETAVRARRNPVDAM